MVDQAPRTLAGRYEVGTLIGRGGMADVHIGRDTRLGRTVAIKILRSDLARDPSFQARFRREAQAAAALNHPSIVAVYDTGEDTVIDPTGASAQVPFIVMEYVEGQTVREILRDGQAVPLNEAAEILDGVLSALDYSHRAGIVHRDIKPANVMITPTGSVKVMDFGIARAIADSAATMTQASSVIGTAQYLSPEQARGEVVDARSDIYSAGCLFYELLTGRPPFTGDSPVSVAYQHVREAPLAPSAIASDVPEELDRITLRALAKDKADRYQSAADFRADLLAFARGGALEAPALPIVTAAAAGLEPKDVSAGPATAATQAFAPAADSTQAMPAWGAVNGPGSPVGGAGTPGAPGTSPTTAGMFPPVAGPGGSGTDAWGQPTSALPAVDEEEETSKKKLAIILTIVGVVVIGIIIGIIAMLNSGGNGDDDPLLVAVPDMTGMNAAEAQRELEAVDLVFEIGEAIQSDVEQNLFVESDPPVGEEVEPGSTVIVHFSRGQEARIVPDVEGMTVDDAIARLQDEGFEVNPNRLSVNHPDYREGIVVGTNPAAGSEQGYGATITLQVSDGRIEVPDLLGMTEADAEDALAEVALIPDIQTEETDDPNLVGRVISQNPSGSTVVGQQSTVRVVIGEAPPEPAKVRIPTSINGAEEASATADLRALGLEVAVQYENSDTVEVNRVIRSDPAPGTEVDADSTVTLIVSTGPPPDPTPPDPGEGDDGEG